MDEAKLAEGVTNALIGHVKDFVKWIFSAFKSKNKRPPSQDELKALINVLFIDDEDFNYIDRIKEAGWNVNQIRDLTSLEDDHLKRSHIIFLDYVGVGKSLAPSEQGIGLLKAIKLKYPEKIIIFYSGHAGFSLGQEFHMADDWMPKNSDPYIFLQKIEENAGKVLPR